MDKKVSKTNTKTQLRCTIVYIYIYILCNNYMIIHNIHSMYTFIYKLGVCPNHVTVGKYSYS